MVSVCSASHSELCTIKSWLDCSVWLSGKTFQVKCFCVIALQKLWRKIFRPTSTQIWSRLCLKGDPGFLCCFFALLLSPLKPKSIKWACYRNSILQMCNKKFLKIWMPLINIKKRVKKVCSMVRGAALRCCSKHLYFRTLNLQSCTNVRHFSKSLFNVTSSPFV